MKTRLSLLGILMCQVFFGFTQTTSEIPSRLLKYVDSVSTSGITMEQIKSAMDSLQVSTDTIDIKALKKVGRWYAYDLPKYNVKPDGTLDAGPYNQALKSIYSSSSFCSITDKDGANWESDGPLIPDEYGTRAWRGRIDALWVKQGDTNIIVVGTYKSGIYRTTNGGQNWVCVTDNTSFPVLGVKKIIGNPTNPNHFLAITGMEAVQGGLIQSLDAGLTWQIVDNTLPEFNDISFHPTNNNLIFAISKNHLWFSDSTASIWTALSNLGILTTHDYFHSIKVLQNRIFTTQRTVFSGNNNFIYELSFTHDATGVLSHQWNTAEKIAEWTGTNSVKTNFFYFSNVVADTFYGFTKMFDTVGSPKVFKFWNDGSNYDLLIQVFEQGLYNVLLHAGVGVNQHIGSGIQTSNNRMYGAGIDIYSLDRDGGATNINQMSMSSQSNGRHEDYRIGLLYENNGTKSIYYGTDGGIAKINFEANPLELISLNGDLSNNLIHGFHVHEKTGKVLYAFQDHRTRYRDSIGNYNTSNSPYEFLNEGVAALIQRDFPNSMVADDAYNKIEDLSGSTNPIVDDNLVPGGMFLFGQFTRYRHFPERFMRGFSKHDSMNLGGIVINRSANVTDKVYLPLSKAINATAICERDPNYIYAASDDPVDNLYHLYKSTDDGYNWDTLANSTVTLHGTTTAIKLQEALNYKGIRGIAVDHFDTSKVYLAIGSTYTEGGTVIDGKFRVLRSTNGGIHFDDYSQGLPALPIDRILSVESNNELLFCATSVGVFYRTNEMSSWKCYSYNLPRVSITGMQYDYCNNMLYVSTYGRGMYKTKVNFAIKKENFEEITANTLWNTALEKEAPVRVKSGYTLTITNEVSFFPNTGIYVEPGATLQLSNAILTNTCTDYWKGIEVHGNNTQTQNSQNQGKVIANNSLIENAREAIMPWKYNDWTKTGGIIQANKTVFRNNKRSIQYMAYQNVHPSNGNILNNIGYFTDCTFEWTDAFFETKPQPAITLNGVKGVKISGCTFQDLRTNVPIVTDRATGIFSIDAGYLVKGRLLVLTDPNHDYYDENNYDVCKFINLHRGIENTSGHSAHPFVVDHCKFQNCQKGLTISAIDNALLTRNYFVHDTLGPPEIWRPHDLNLVSSSGFIVEGNVFDNPLGINNMGITALNTSIQDNQVRRNKFYNQNVANFGAGSNANDLSQQAQLASGLQYRCNENTDNLQDIFVGAFQGPNQGIRLFQGSTSEPTGNIVSANLQSNGLHFKTNDVQNLKYYWKSANEEPILTFGNISTIFTVQDNFCPAIFGDVVQLQDDGILVPSELSQYEGNLTTYKDTLATLKTTYENKLSAGNHSNLFNLVHDLSLSSRLGTKDSLLRYSPYLSVGLLTELANTPVSIFPEIWLKEVLEANIESLYNLTFKSFLTTKSQPISSANMDSLQSFFDANLTQRGLDISEIGGLTSRIAQLESLLFTEYSLGETYTTKDLSDFILARNNYVKRAELIDFHLGWGSLDEVDNQIATLQSEIPTMKNTAINAELSDFISLKAFVLNHLNDANTFNAELSNEEIAFLMHARDSFQGRAAQQAENILCFYEGICAEFDPMDWVINGRSVSSYNGSPHTQLSMEKEALCTLYPNPNTGDFVIEGNENFEIVDLRIVDLQGKTIPYTHYRIGDFMVQIDLKGVDNGIYLVQVTNQMNQLQTLRIIKK